MKSNNPQKLIVLDYGNSTVNWYVGDFDDVELFIEEKTPHRLTDCEWMYGDNIEEVIHEK